MEGKTLTCLCVQAPDFSNEQWFKKPKDKFIFHEDGSLEEARKIFCRNGRIDVVLLTVNAEELKAVLKKFCLDTKADAYEVLEGTLGMYFVKVGHDELGVAVLHQEMGGAQQQAVVTDIVALLHPAAVISVGVGWGNKWKGGDFGDVMVAKSIVDFSDNAKWDENDAFYPRNDIPWAGGILYNRFATLAVEDRWDFTR